jgi:hypothetical protein
MLALPPLQALKLGQNSFVCLMIIKQRDAKAAETPPQTLTDGFNLTMQPALFKSVSSDTASRRTLRQMRASAYVAWNEIVTV